MTGRLTLGERIQTARERTGLSQAELAQTLGVAREVISYWENDRRNPSSIQLNQLATHLSVTTAILLGHESFPDPENDPNHTIFGSIADQPLNTRTGIKKWLAFLDLWAETREHCGDSLSGPSRPPQHNWRSPVPITDNRRTTTLAADVRTHYNLGSDAIPDLPVLLDQIGILVYRIPLDPIGANGAGISGAYYNHPKLGASILINTNTTPGRQMFTAAHELAHALFHYQTHGIISRAGDRDPRERFADSFAANFLVPAEPLRQCTLSLGGIDDPRKALALQRYFRVSYATILNRLADISLLDANLYRTYSRLSPSDLAKRMGLDYTDYIRKPAASWNTYSAYPPTVLAKLRTFIDSDCLGIPAAATLLDVSQDEITGALNITPNAATPAEEDEFAELPAPAARKSRTA